MTVRFEMCRCGQHGRVVFANELQGYECCFKERSLQLIRIGLQLSVPSMTESEAITLMEEVQASPLPPSPELADLSLMYRVERYNQEKIQEEIFNLNPEEIHKRVSQPFDEKEIPPDFLEAMQKQMLELATS